MQFYITLGQDNAPEVGTEYLTRDYQLRVLATTAPTGPLIQQRKPLYCSEDKRYMSWQLLPFPKRLSHCHNNIISPKKVS